MSNGSPQSFQLGPIELRQVNSVLYTNRLDQSPSNLLFYLWAPDRVTGQSCPGLSVPETVFISSGQLVAWFSTSEQGGISRREHVKQADRKSIQSAFLQATTPRVGEKTSKILALFYPDNFKGLGQDCITLSARDLESFLISMGLKSGVLQAHVKSLDDTLQTIYSCTWAPNLFSVRRSTLAQRSGRAPGDFRTTDSFDPGLFPSVNLSAKRSGYSGIYHRLRAMCESIVRHVHYVSPQKYWITSLEVHFQLDDAGRLWFLYASQVQVANPLQMKVRMEKILKIAGVTKAKARGASRSASEDVSNAASGDGQFPALSSTGSSTAGPGTGGRRISMVQPASAAPAALAPASRSPHTPERGRGWTSSPRLPSLVDKVPRGRGLGGSNLPSPASGARRGNSGAFSSDRAAGPQQLGGEVPGSRMSSVPPTTPPSAPRLRTPPEGPMAAVPAGIHGAARDRGVEGSQRPPTPP